MKIKVGIIFTFNLAAGSNIALSMLRWLISAEIHEHIENHLPEGWLMKVHRVYIDDVEVEMETK